MAHRFETVLGRLGSRFTLDFLPQENRILYSAMGKYFDEPLPLQMTFTRGPHQRALPFTTGEGLEMVEQVLTPTSVTFRCHSRELGVAVELSFLAPFYPQDVETSCLPVHVVRVSWARRCV